MEVGPDATTTKFFGTDLLRLTGDKVRLKFIDTSATGTNNDWRIRINNGGETSMASSSMTWDPTTKMAPRMVNWQRPFESKRVRATTPLVISDILKPGNNGSRIGLGTDSPAASLHISNAATPSIRLERTGEINAPPHGQLVAEPISLSATYRSRSLPLQFDQAPSRTLSSSHSPTSLQEALKLALEPMMLERTYISNPKTPGLS